MLPYDAFSRDDKTILYLLLCCFFQSTAAINLCHATKAIQRIFKQVGQPYTQNSVPTSVIEFDLRILFLITAHSEDAR